MNTTITRTDKITPGKNEPHWIRLPKTGQLESRTGLTRSALTRLCDEGKVKSISLRDPAKTRGCRLVNLESLLRYLSNLEEAQNYTTGGQGLVKDLSAARSEV